MATLVQDVRASDNKYLHRDFHASNDICVRYLGEKYGDNGVKEFLREYALAYYTPLVEKIKAEGLAVLQNKIESDYEYEEVGEVCHTSLKNDVLTVTIDRCPGIMHIKEICREPSKWYIELTRTVNETIADMAKVGFEMISYNEENGAAKYRYFIRSL